MTVIKTKLERYIIPVLQISNQLHLLIRIVMAAPRNVIALISGGKDSIYSILHVLEQGHNVVALGNLYPAQTSQPAETHDGNDPESHMYQTAGHSLIPHIAQCLDLPLIRREIKGTNVSKSATYVKPEDGDGQDETEDLDLLLQDIMQQYPEANAVSSGAILSTYQRTRIETVALRRGLVPLAYLWQYTTLTADEGEDALLKHMGVMGVEARIVKVASGGLDEGNLWTDVASYRGRENIKKRIMRFGEGEGAVIGEGGEFETLVLNGPDYLWKKRMIVEEDMMQVVKGEGGTASIAFKISADGKEVCKLEEKTIDPAAERPKLAKPKVLEDAFQKIFDALIATPRSKDSSTNSASDVEIHYPFNTAYPELIQHPDPCSNTIRFTLSGSNFVDVISTLRSALATHRLSPKEVTSTVVLIKDMKDFGVLNRLYSGTFCHANPPSRACVAVGELLPKDTIAVMHITAYKSLTGASLSTKALHVQSLSYWAPANIGPYSQAQSSLLSTRSSARGVAVAGQIPLVPATMSFTTEFDGREAERFAYETTLSAQHAWRIGKETDVKLFTSGAAFLPHLSSEEESRQKAIVAGAVWRALHTEAKEDCEEDEGNEDEEDVDLWELQNRHGAEQMGASATIKSLPDWSSLKIHDEENTKRGGPDYVSPFFAAEVESLPMNASVEWLPGLGVTADVEVLPPNERRVFDSRNSSEDMHEVVEYKTLAGGRWLFTTYFVYLSETLNDWKFLVDRLRNDPNQGPGWMVNGTAHKFADNLNTLAERTYVDVAAPVNGCFWTSLKAGVVPARRLWSADGRRLAAVVCFKDEVEPRVATKEEDEDSE